MPRLTRSGVVTTSLLMGACLVPQHGQAAMGAPDADGVVHDAQIDELASWIAGRPYAIDCTPDPGDGSLGRTWFSGVELEDGSTSWDQADSSELNGNECGSLDQLLNAAPGFYKRAMVTHAAPIKKGAKLKQRSGGGIDVVWPSTRTYQAAEALWDLQHEVTHGIESTGGFATPPGQDDAAPAFDEGLTECTALRNIWNTVKHVTPVGWLRHDLLDDVKGDHADTPDEYRTVC